MSQFPDKNKIPLHPIFPIFIIIGAIFLLGPLLLLAGEKNPILLLPGVVSLILFGIAFYVFYSREKIFNLIDDQKTIILEAKISELYKQPVTYIRGAQFFGATSRANNIVAKTKDKTFYQYGIHKKLSLKIGQKIKVYIDPTDEYNYFIDYTPFIETDFSLN